jgi:hypothetical protein
MSLMLQPMAGGSTRGERGGRATGIFADGVREVAPWMPMREAVLRKAGRHGAPDLPFVVALGALDRDTRLEHAVEALYGTEDSNGR